jgi:hypothetical protein
MRERTQIQWIAEAEARTLGETALSQRARLDPPIGIVWAEPGSLWSEWLQKTMSRLVSPRSCQVSWRSDRRGDVLRGRPGR